MYQDLTEKLTAAVRRRPN